jgi:hypothetical protein
MSQIRSYLENRPLADDNAEIERIARKSRMYYLIDGVLYRQGANGMMMRCISKDECIQLLRDIHSGVCGAHSSWRSIVEKAFRHGFYWPTAKDDAMEIVASSRSKPRSMRILFDPLIYLGPLQYGESTLWGFSQELQEVSDSYSSELIHSPSGWRPPQW